MIKSITYFIELCNLYENVLFGISIVWWCDENMLPVNFYDSHKK